MFNIETFKSQIQTGVMQPNKFMFEFTVPTILQSSYGVAKTMSYWCEASSIPGIQLAMHEVRRLGYGAFERKPHSPTFTDINISVLSDNKGKNYKFWYDWISNITHFEYDKDKINNNLFELEYKDNYASTVSVTAYDNAGNPKIRVYLLDAFPSFIENINLNWNDTNNAMRIPISLSFLTWSYDDALVK